MGHQPAPPPQLKALSAQMASEGSRLSLSRFNRKPAEPSLEESLEIGANHPDNPLLVTTAQPSAYWSGRFVALHDRYHGELLCPQNLHTVIEAHAARSSISKSSKIPSNPPTKIYAPARAQSKQSLSRSPQKSGPRIPFFLHQWCGYFKPLDQSYCDLGLTPIPSENDDSEIPPVPRLDAETYRDILVSKAAT